MNLNVLLSGTGVLTAAAIIVFIVASSVFWAYSPRSSKRGRRNVGYCLTYLGVAIGGIIGGFFAIAAFTGGPFTIFVLPMAAAAIAIGFMLGYLGNFFVNNNKDEIEVANAIKNAIEGLREELIKNCRDHPEKECSVYVATTDKKAREYGWPNATAMRQGVEETLRVLPHDVSKRCIVKEV